MLRLLRLISLLTLVLITGLVAIIGLTYRNTNRFSYLFTRSDGRECATSCILGVVPAHLTPSETDQTLVASPVLKHATKKLGDQPDSLIYSIDGVDVSVSLSQFVQIEVAFSNDFPTLGELLVLLGKPSAISIYTQFTNINMAACDGLDLMIQDQRLKLGFRQFEPLSADNQAIVKCLSRLDREIATVQIEPLE